MKDFRNFEKFANFSEEIPFDYTFLIDENNLERYNKYNILNQIIEKYKNIKFNETKNLEKMFDLAKYGIDNFYLSSSNLILSNLNLKDFAESSIYKNFYKNICEKLFTTNTKLLEGIKLLYDPDKFKEIKKYGVSTRNIHILIKSYRYCINELWENDDKSIYQFLYNKNNVNKYNNKYYPGNDIKPIPYNDLYSKIINHFNTNTKDGCYVCLCEKGYYHSVIEGIPQKKSYCPKCYSSIGADLTLKNIKGWIKRNKYYRIYKDNEMKAMEERKNFNKAYSMTVNEFYKKYIEENENSKGVTKITIEDLNKENKIIRNLSQVSYRLLNFILYSHFFFARIYTEDKKYDECIPIELGNSWITLLTNCWISLKNELLEENINDIDMFMDYVFPYVFEILNTQKSIEKYSELINVEDKLENVIKYRVDSYKERLGVYKRIIDEDQSKIFESKSLLDEKYDKSNYNQDNYPFYENFYYSDYIDEDFIENKIRNLNKRNYPVLSKYLNYLNSPYKDYNVLYSPENLDLYNTTLNLFNETYSYQITREYAETQNLETEEIYKKNADLIDKFLDFYNKLKIVGKGNKIIELKKTDKLINFMIDDNTDIGKSYKIIYKKFGENQNKEIEKLLEIKIENGKLDINSGKKIYIQNIKEDEIFLPNPQGKFSLIEIAFNNSYRKVLDTYDYRTYNIFEINLEAIEDNLTDLLLKNKKLVDVFVPNFVYKNEDISFGNINLLTSFKKKYKVEEELSIENKKDLYQFYISNKGNTNLYLNFIGNFINLFVYLNNKKEISGEQKLKEVFISIEKERKFSDNFKLLFNDSFTVNKLFNAFEYYLILIFEIIKETMKNYQIDLSEKSKKEIESYLKQDHFIKKENLSKAIRLFVTLYLYKEDKERKVKTNRNNIMSYLSVIPDLWEKNIFENAKFKEDSVKLNDLGIQINQMMYGYEKLGGDLKNDFFNDVIEAIQRDEEQKKKIEENKKRMEEQEEQEEGNMYNTNRNIIEQQNEDENDDKAVNYYLDEDDDGGDNDERE